MKEKTSSSPRLRTTPTSLQQEMVIRKLTEPNILNLINGYINLI